jgi:hypothetical protein
MNAIDKARRILELDKARKPILVTGNGPEAFYRNAYETLAPEVAKALLETDETLRDYKCLVSALEGRLKEYVVDLVGARSREEEHYNKLCEAIELLKDAYPGMIDDPDMHPAGLIEKIDEFLEGK